MVASDGLTPEEVAEFAELDKRSSDPGTKIAVSGDVRPYDFAKPDKMSKTHLKVAQMMLTPLERLWSVSLSTLLKADIFAHLNSVEQTGFSVYTESLPESVLLSQVSLVGLPGRVFIDMPGELALCAVDRMAGGRGLVDKCRPLSKVEIEVIRRVFDKLVSDLAVVMRPVVETSARVVGFEQSADDVEAQPGDVVLVAGFVLSAGDAEHKVNIMIEGSTIDAIRDYLTPERFMSVKTESQGLPSMNPASLIGGVEMESSVELGRANISFRDVIEIGVGDVIRLDKTVDDSLDVRVHGAVKFHARPGMIGHRMAVQIVEKVDEEGNQVEEPVLEAIQEAMQEAIVGD